jgi:hypothetical protein
MTNDQFILLCAGLLVPTVLFLVYRFKKKRYTLQTFLDQAAQEREIMQRQSTDKSGEVFIFVISTAIFLIDMWFGFPNTFSAGQRALYGGAMVITGWRIVADFLKNHKSN